VGTAATPWSTTAKAAIVKGFISKKAGAEPVKE